MVHARRRWRPRTRPGWLAGVLLVSACSGSAESPSSPAAPADRAKAHKLDAAPEALLDDAAAPEPAAGQPDITAEDAPPAVEPAPPAPEVLALTPDRSTSIGSPTGGHLEGAAALPLRAPGLLFNPAKDPQSRHGTIELVQGLVKAAAAVERADSGAPVTISDLSRAAGGDIPGHASHRCGRDVDVLFYLVREDGQPFVPAKAIPLDPEGRGTDYRDLAEPSDDIPVRIDVGRTWRFVEALIGDQAASVQRIFIVEHLRAMLLQHAREVGAPAALVERFAEVSCQPRFPHDDHMHIRVFCSAEDIAAGCEDSRPIYPWRREDLSAQGVRPVLAGQRRGPAPRLKTAAKARAEAGPMHEDVVQFLDRRKAWARKPHPGRRWCK